MTGWPDTKVAMRCPFYVGISHRSLVLNLLILTLIEASLTLAPHSTTHQFDIPYISLKTLTFFFALVNTQPSTGVPPLNSATYFIAYGLRRLKQWVEVKQLLNPLVSLLLLITDLCKSNHQVRSAYNGHPLDAYLST